MSEEWRVPLFKVPIGAGAAKTVERVLASGYVGEGPVSSEFETSLAEWIGNPNVAVTNSGTSALTLALRLAGVGSGSEVISSPMTCLATNAAVASLGARVRWADVDPRSGNIDPATIPPLLTKRSRAILFVDWAGVPAELSELRVLAEEVGLPLVEDAAHALGARYGGELVGNHCHFVCFSFQAVKTLSTVDGGALSMRSDRDASRARLLRWYGLPRELGRSNTASEHDVAEIGYKMHLNDVLASIGLAQLPELATRVATQQHNAKRIAAMLDDVHGIQLQRVPSAAEPSYWILSILVEGVDRRARVVKALEQNSIQCSPVHRRNDLYSVFNYARRSLPGVDEFSARQISIPCGWWVSEPDCVSIARTIASAAVSS